MDNEKKGKITVIEGTDCSGKGYQKTGALLCGSLETLYAGNGTG